MNKDGDNDLFKDISFEDDLIIEGAETSSNTSNEQTIEEAKDGNTDTSVNSNETSATAAQPNEDGLIEFDEPSTTAESSSDASASESSDSETSASSSSPFSFITNALGAEGFIEVSDDELDGVEDHAEFLRNKLNEAIDKKVKSGLSERKLKALEAFEKGVPMEDYVNSNARETQYASISAEQIDENVQLQQQLIARSQQARGYSEEEILDNLKTYQDVGGDKMKEKALAAQKHLISIEQDNREKMLEQAEAAKKAQEEQRKDELNNIKDFVTKQKEIIPGLELTDSTKDDIYKIMTTPTGQDKNGNPVNAIGAVRDKDPNRFNMLMTYYYHLGLFDEKPNLSKLEKVAETKVSKGLDNLLQEGTSFMTQSGGTKDANLRSEDDFGLDFI